MENKYYRSFTVEEALSLLDDNSVILAGGTDIIPRWRKKRLEIKSIVDISSIDSLKGITQTPDEVRIGVLTTFAEIIESPIINKYFPCLAESAKQIGSPLIRNRGTIGGNIVTASPAADSILPLIVYDAKLQSINSLKNTRILSIEDAYKPPQFPKRCNYILT